MQYFISTANQSEIFSTANSTPHVSALLGGREEFWGAKIMNLIETLVPAVETHWIPPKHSSSPEKVPVVEMQLMIPFKYAESTGPQIFPIPIKICVWHGIFFADTELPDYHFLNKTKVLNMYYIPILLPFVTVERLGYKSMLYRLKFWLLVLT